ncbi:hypothetical protein DPMN_156831 [Dreissena polymorpha]|uniref:Uncharacterized protein n=1 Tax=Dreissena polymorpha TaxID=45954 RepID=A0A9D4FL15_DREPO|nr:hypothetical protein DPMN_152303 [Dreissena polymorpha]KAH3803129.1 hypothetical protein DPMN_156831 [Dreissena polymorpha]
MSLGERRSLGSVGFTSEERGNNWEASDWSMRKEGIPWWRRGGSDGTGDHLVASKRP